MTGKHRRPGARLRTLQMAGLPCPAKPSGRAASKRARSLNDQFQAGSQETSMMTTIGKRPYPDDGAAVIGRPATMPLVTGPGRPVRASRTRLRLAVAAAVKDQLKFVFGRTWPETWVHNNPSFIRDGVYGFNPFHGGPEYAAFPSGHTTAICAVISVLWICYPRYRVLYGICMAAVALGLVGADFHFLGDVIAGAFLGVSIGWLTVVLWERGQHHLRTAMTPDFPGKSDRDLAPDFHYLVPRKAKEVGPVN